MSELEKFLGVAKKSAKEAGRLLTEYFSKDFNPFYKTDFDFVLEVDKKSEKIIVDNIRRNFPSHNICSEEMGSIDHKSEYTWFIDPLDGTHNYYAGISYYGISIALNSNSETIIGVVYNPTTNQLFSAIRGMGAQLGQSELICISKKISPYSTLSFVKGHKKSGETDTEANQVEQKVSANFTRVLRMWAPALDWCLLAQGKIDALISYESEREDLLAGLLIAQEAGVEVYNFDGRKYQYGNNKIIASRRESIKRNLEFVKPFSG